MEKRPSDRFLAEAAKYPSMWDAIDIRFVGAKRGDSICLLGLQGTLSTNTNSPTYKELLFETPDVVMIRETVPITELSNLIQDLTGESATIGSTPVILEGFSLFECRQWGGGSLGLISIKYPYVLFYSYGKSVSELVSESDIVNKLLQWGYRSLRELCQEKLGFPVGGGNSTRIELIMPIYFNAEADFVDSKLRLVLRCHPSLTVSDLSASFEVSLDVSGRQETKRGTVSFSEKDRIQEGFEYSLVNQVDLQPQVKSAMVWVFHRSRNDPMYALYVRKSAAIELNSSWIALKYLLSRYQEGQLINGEDVFQEKLGLKGEVKDLYRFEAAVTDLLACTGYSCLFTGHAFGIRGIDILAFSSNYQEAVLVSVTTSNNLGEKITTLLPQLNTLKDRLKDITFRPAIFAPIRLEDVVYSDKQDAKTHGIALVLLPEIQGLFDAITRLSMTEARSSLNSILDMPKQMI